jgi:sulfate transport system ATP-binding protein
MSILLEQLTKRYEGYPVVNHVSLEIPEGEFFVLLGPSGSGKSTLLRMVAGLNSVDEGRVILRGREVTTAPPQERGVGFVFQHYALFQHMSVAENVEFALQVRRVPGDKRRQRREELLELVGLAGLGGRRPNQLSGGQQQRVALARALAHRPDVLLLDEPFGALDAKIRVELRRSLRRIQTELGITTIFVTHDQEEAFELADRLGVMNFGRLLEVGAPTQLYQRPQTEFVATFLGTANLLIGESTAGGVQVGPLHFPLRTEAAPANPALEARRVQVLFRPEEVALAAAPEELDGAQLGQGEVEQCAFAGSTERLRLRLPPIAGLLPVLPLVQFGDNSILVEATRPQDQARRFPLQPGDRPWVGVRRIHALVHPGMNFLIVTDGSAAAQAAVALGGQIARLAHARVTVLTYGLKSPAPPPQLQVIKEHLGSGLAALEVRASAEPAAGAIALEAERQPFDLVILGGPPHASLSLAESAVQSGEHHLLIVPAAHAIPRRALVAVTGSEPGKEDILFAGRLLRHLGSAATLLSVLPDSDPGQQERAQSFLAEGAGTLALLGVRAGTHVAAGPVRDNILALMRSAGHDLLVLGVPLPGRDGRPSFSGLIAQILTAVPEHPLLIVRSRFVKPVTPPLTAEGRIRLIEERPG